MSLTNPEIIFERTDGGLGVPAPGEDHISAMLFFTDTLPSGFAADDRIKQIFSLKQAEDLGIVSTGNAGLDGTSATNEVTIDDIGTDGDKITFKINRGSGKTKVTLGVYTKVSADDDTTKVATAVASVINNNTDTHGYTATSALAVVTISAPEKDGDEANSYTVEITKNPSGSTFAITAAGFSSGVDPYIDVPHYHINEFFRVRGNIDQGSTGLYVGFFATPSGSHDFEEVKTMQRFAEGKIRQIGVFTTETFASADVTTLHSVCENMYTKDMPLVAVYTANMSGTTDLATLPDLSTLEAFRVGVAIGQDGANVGDALYDFRDYTIGCMGAALACLSAGAVNENIGWVNKFKLLTGKELDVPAFGNGTKLRTLDEAAIDAVGDKHYLFIKKYTGIPGTYFNDSRTAISQTSDYSTLENVRVFDKAVRLVRQALLPSLKSPILLTSEGKIDPDTREYLINEAQRPLDRMALDNEISAVEVLIDPSQDVAATGEIEVAIKKVPTGVARTFRIKIGFTNSIS